MEHLSERGQRYGNEDGEVRQARGDVAVDRESNGVSPKKSAMPCLAERCA